ncbi:RRP12-like protein [Rhopilema esculentum]|uniref:RRP12-like protein n=1 Tax=Rhopilema esculentum TaxID=499914 RepID=UPI0031DDE366|eukprot:gene12413-3076_t
MGKRSFKATKSAKKWRKGESCASNPTQRKFRDEVTKQTITPFQTANVSKKNRSGLTAAALSRHQDELSVEDEIMSDKGMPSSKASSSKFSISGLTDCSNLTFEKVHKLWYSPSEEHKQICAVLAAVTEVIRANGGKETETEYFAALLVALQGTKDEPSIASIIFLLNLVIKRLPQAVIQHKFAEVSKILVETLGNQVDTEKTSVLKNLISCLSTLLRNQDGGIWQDQSTRQLFQSILSFTVSAKAKVRKTAQTEIASLVKLNLANKKSHITSTLVTKFCLQHLQETGLGPMTSSLHILNLLKIVLPALASENLKALSEAVMNLMKTSNTVTKLNCLQTLDSLFSAHPPEENLPVWLNGKMISALYDFQPSINDVNIAGAWLKAMLSAYENLSIVGEKECLASLPRIFASVMTFILSDSRVTVSYAAETAKGLVEKCMVPSRDLMESDTDDKGLSSFQSIFRQIEHGLKYKYQPAWNVVIDLITLFFKEFGRKFHKNMIKCLVNLCELHNNEDFPLLKEVEKSVSQAFRSMGPKVVLSAIPLKLVREDKKCDFPRAWMLSLIKDNIEGAELQFFISHFLPTLAHLREREASSMEAGLVLEATIYSTLQQQVWSLLPGFFNKPIDLKESFKNIARILGKALVDEPKLRLVILQSIRAAVTKAANTDEEVNELRKFSKNYLPILFNLYLTESEAGNEHLSLPVLETIKTYVKISDEPLITVFVENAHGKLKEEGCPQKKRQALLDLLIAMVAYSSEDCISKVYNTAISLIQSVEVSEQKKAYRILEEICDGRSEACQRFALKKLDDMKERLFTSMSATAPSSKAPRLRCLTGIIKMLKAEKKDFLMSILPEVILCTKANNEKAREAAFNLVVEIGNSTIYHGDKSKEESVSEYIELVMAGLAASSHMISATLISLGKISSVYREFLEPNIVQKLLLSSVGLLRSKDREVQKSALALSKALVTLLDHEELLSNVRVMVKNLFDGKRGDKNILRTQTKFILEKLIKKLGYKTVVSVTPAEHQKFITAINKGLEKKRQASQDKKEMLYSKRRKGTKQEESSDLSSDEENQQFESTRKTKKSESWIMEQGHEVVDLLDNKVASKISGTEPRAGKRKPDGGFATQDGKLVINEMETSEPPAEYIPIHEDKQPTPRKRPFKNSNDNEENTGYQPGGIGIHRAGTKQARKLEASQTQDSFGSEYKAKKAGGDMKVRGKPDPFTYIPLDRQNLNRRKRAKISGKFHGIVKATKRSAKVAKTFNTKKRRK